MGSWKILGNCRKLRNELCQYLCSTSVCSKFVRPRKTPSLCLWHPYTLNQRIIKEKGFFMWEVFYPRLPTAKIALVICITNDHILRTEFMNMNRSNIWDPATDFRRKHGYLSVSIWSGDGALRKWCIVRPTSPCSPAEVQKMHIIVTGRRRNCWMSRETGHFTSSCPEKKASGVLLPAGPNRFLAESVVSFTFAIGMSAAKTGVLKPRLGESHGPHSPKSFCLPREWEVAGKARGKLRAAGPLLTEVFTSNFIASFPLQVLRATPRPEIRI